MYINFYLRKIRIIILYKKKNILNHKYFFYTFFNNKNEK